jgi:hypothetical protein
LKLEGPPGRASPFHGSQRRRIASAFSFSAPSIRQWKQIHAYRVRRSWRRWPSIDFDCVDIGQVTIDFIRRTAPEDPDLRASADVRSDAFDADDTPARRRMVSKIASDARVPTR